MRVCARNRARAPITVRPALFQRARIGRPGVNALEERHRLGMALLEPAARAAAASSGKLIWMSAAVNSLPANHSLLPSSPSH